MKNEQFTFITHDLKGSICIDFKIFSVAEIKDIIMDMDDISKLTIRIPYKTEYSVIKDIYTSDGMTPDKIQRITLDFVD
jgi:hypothetical protein